MQTRIGLLVKRTVLVAVSAAGLAVVPAPEAQAHGIVYRPGYVELHYAYAVSYPGWLRRDRAFQRWYWHSPYRLKRHLGWQRLYHLYLDDWRYHRHMRRSHVHRHDHAYRGDKKKRRH